MKMSSIAGLDVDTFYVSLITPIQLLLIISTLLITNLFNLPDVHYGNAAANKFPQIHFRRKEILGAVQFSTITQHI